MTKSARSLLRIKVPRNVDDGCKMIMDKYNRREGGGCRMFMGSRRGVNVEERMEMLSSIFPPVQ
jgi:hypothetical protein